MARSYELDVPRIRSVVGRSGKTVFLLGTASNGPLFDVVKLTNEEQVLSTFGTTGTIPEAYRMALQAEADCDIFAMKVTGNSSMLHLNVNVLHGDVENNGLVFTAKGASHLYDQIAFNISEENLDVVYPPELGGHTISYDLNAFSVIGLLVRAINRDAEESNGYIYASSELPLDTPMYGALVGVNAPFPTMYGGDDGVDWNKVMLFNALTTAYGLIESMKIDVLIPLNAFMDDVHPIQVYGESFYNEDTMYIEDRDYLNYTVNETPATFHRQLIDFCKLQMAHGIKTHGVMGMNKLTDIPALQDSESNTLRDLISASPLGKRIGFNEVNPDTPNEDDGMFVSIVLGDLQFIDSSIYNGYVVYGLSYATTDINLSTTNQPLNDTIELVHEFTTEELEYLALKGVTSFRVSPLKGLVVHNGVSAANPDSDFHTSCNGRMVQLILAKIKSTLDKYIGEPMRAIQDKGELETDVDNIFKNAEAEGVVKNHSYSFDYDFESNIITIQVKLQTLYMIDGVEATIS